MLSMSIGDEFNKLHPQPLATFNNGQERAPGLAGVRLQTNFQRNMHRSMAYMMPHYK